MDIKKKFEEFLKDNHNKIFLLILVFAIAIRIYYFSINSAVWWDEAEYLNKAKSMAFGTSYNSVYSARKPILLPFLMSILFKFGGTEPLMHFLVSLLSIGSIVLIYFLGKELFDKKTALISTAMASAFWLDLFFNARILTDGPATFFTLLTFFFFIKYYNTKQNKYLYISCIMYVLAFLMRISEVLIIIAPALMLLITERLKLFKEKKTYIALLFILLTLIPWMIWLKVSYPSHTISKFTGLGNGEQRFNVGHPWLSGFIAYSANFPTYLQWPFLIPFVFGLLIVLSALIIGYDLVLKEIELQKYLFLIMWILPTFLFYSMFLPNMEDRFLLPIFPAIFLIAAIGLSKLYDYISKKNIRITHAIVIGVLLMGIYLQASYAQQAIDSKKDSYLQVKEAALWIKQNSNPNDLVISNSVPQNIYYSDRNTTYLNSKQDFENFINNSKPKFMVASVFEQSYDWYYAYPSEHNNTIMPVQAYFADQAQTKPLLIIYQFKY